MKLFIPERKSFVNGPVLEIRVMVTYPKRMLKKDRGENKVEKRKFYENEKQGLSFRGNCCKGE